MIETVAINQLDARRERLWPSRSRRRFGVADSYDRAARTQFRRPRTLMRRLAILDGDRAGFHRGCAARPNKPLGTAGTLAELRNVRPTCKEVKVEQGLDRPCSNTGASSRRHRRPR